MEAAKCFNRRISSSLCRDRFAALTRMPRLVPLETRTVCRESACCRQLSSNLILPQAAFNKPMLCPFVNPLLRTPSPFRPSRFVGGPSAYDWLRTRGAAQSKQPLKTDSHEV